jgi:hypothetical protein
MNDPEARLAELWALDHPPAHDPIFEETIAVRIERRRWLQTALELLALTLAALAVGWAAWPFAAADLPHSGPWLAIAAAVGLAVWSAKRTFDGLLFGGYEDFTRDLASD